MISRRSGRHGVSIRDAISVRIAAVFALLVLAACQTQLAPSYDEVTDKGLTDLNASIAEFVASVPQQGFAPSTLAAHDTFYAETQGKIEALKARAQARPVPDSPVVDWLGLGKAPEDAKGIGIGQLAKTTPTIENLDIIAGILADMRTAHATTGLSQTFAKHNLEQIQIALQNAITYEIALKR